VLQRGNRPFYTISDSDDGSAEIIKAFIRNVMDVTPKAMHGNMQSPGDVHGAVRLATGHLLTSKTSADAKMFSRFVKLEGSNQRTFSESPYINDFTARGVILVDEYYIKGDEMLRLMETGGRAVGIGSARLMGFGRFTVSNWSKV